MTPVGLREGLVAVSTEKSCDRHRCDLVMLGVSRERGARPYRWDNRRRGPFCLYQHTLAGMGRFEDAAGRRYDLPPGTGFLVASPSPTRYWLPSEGNWTFLFALFAGDAARYHVEAILAERGPLHRHEGADDPDGAARAMGDLLGLHQRWDRRRAGQAAGDARPDPWIGAGAIWRLLMALRSGPPAHPESAPEARARRLIEERWRDPALTLDDLAAAAGWSRHHFARRYRAAYGVSPFEDLIHTRLRRALERLLTSSEPIKRIALSHGFQDVAYFSRAFKQRFGHAPSQVRAAGMVPESA